MFGSGSEVADEARSGGRSADWLHRACTQPEAIAAPPAFVDTVPVALDVDVTCDSEVALDDAELITRISQLERAKAACAAEQARLTARFVDSQAAAAARLRERAEACSDAGDFNGWVAARDEARACEVDPTPRDEPGRSRRQSRSARRATLSRTGVSAQVGLARRESPSRGARLANASMALVHDLPHTLAALSAGLINERRADLVVRGTSHLDPELRRIVDAEVIGANLVADNADDLTAPGGVASWGDREVERRVRACADHLDAAAAVERSRLAENERHVSIRPVPDAMALVTALLPVAQAVAVHAALSQAALTGKAAGDERGKGQLMADTLVERVTGQAAADDVSVEVQVVITDRGLIAGEETPAHVPGYGPVPSAWVRDLLTRHLTPEDSTTAAAGAGVVADTATPEAAATWLRRLYTHPATGTLVGMDSSRRLFPAGLRRFLVARDGTCRTPWCDAPVAHADHVVPHASGGPTSAANGQGLCVRCNLVKEEPRWSTTVIHAGPAHPATGLSLDEGEGADGQPHTVEIRTPTGHRYRSSAPPVLLPPPSPVFSPSSMPDVDVGCSEQPGQPHPAGAPGDAVVIELYRHPWLEVELTA
jgi:hypothetical protein